MADHGQGILEKGILEDGSSSQSGPIKAFTAWVVYIIRPSFLTRGSFQRGKLRKTAYLDGLRGFSALLVYWLHHQLWTHGFYMPTYENAYGYDGRYFFVALPFVRTFFTGGHFGVACFYVISGYVLSLKSLSLIQNGQQEKLTATLASALFRRWPRLYIPVFGTTFLYMVFWHTTGIKPENPMAQSNLHDEFWWWYANMKNYSFVFKDGGVPWSDYNFHSWSIPAEYKGSLVVFTACMAFSTCTRNARLWCCAGLFLYFFTIVEGWFIAAFVAGMMLADLDLMAEKGNLPMPELFARMAPYKRSICRVMFVVALYLGGAPSNVADAVVLRNNPGWYYLSFFHPHAMDDPKWAFMVPGAIMMIIVIPRLPWLRAFFESRFAQYLGRISFSFYLVHGPVLWILGDRVYAMTGMVRDWHLKSFPHLMGLFRLPSNGPIGLELCFLIPQIFLLPFTFWVAEVVTKLFDEPSVRVTQWLYEKSLGSSH